MDNNLTSAIVMLVGFLGGGICLLYYLRWEAHKHSRSKRGKAH